MTTEHTATPWIKYGAHIQRGSRIIAQIWAKKNPKEAEANAEFIVRACNNFEQLREALRQIAEAESVCCPRCEGDGRLWADGKAHYPSEQRDTILCGNCGGSGYLQPENAKDIAATTIAE